MSPGSSPCPSPVRELAANLRRAGSPCKNKYKTLVGSQEPIISKGRLTMTGGFTDLRPRPIDHQDSLESEEESSSSMYSSSRSDSCDSGDAILEPHPERPARRYFKVPKKALSAAMGHLSPRLQKKLQKVQEPPSPPQHPMWPTVMATYGRGVTSSPVQAIMTPPEPSLTAMKAQAILDERRDVRAALQMLAYKAELQRQVESLTAAALEHCHLDDHDDHDHDDHHDSDSYDSDDDSRSEPVGTDEADCEDKPGPLAAHELFPINPAISVQCPDGRTGTPDEGFQEESLLDALDLDTVPTLTPEELLAVSVNEVRNVHLVSDYLVLETAPSRESVFV